MTPSPAPQRLSVWDAAYAFGLGSASLITHLIMTNATIQVLPKAADFKGTMWAMIATVFVYKDTRENSVAAVIDRLIGTFVSFALCSAYLWVFAPTAIGIGALVAIGTLLIVLIGRRADIGITAITTVVIMVIARDSRDAELEPSLRLVDTFIGVVIGVLFKWVASSLYSRLTGKIANERAAALPSKIL